MKNFTAWASQYLLHDHNKYDNNLNYPGQNQMWAIPNFLSGLTSRRLHESHLLSNISSVMTKI